MKVTMKSASYVVLHELGGELLAILCNTKDEAMAKAKTVNGEYFKLAHP